MRRLLVCPIVILATAVGVAPNVRAEITAKQVRTAIDQGIGFLRQQQRPNGAWVEPLGFDGGVTALCTLALLNAGVEPDDPAIQRALNYLRGVEVERTYVAALQTMVFAQASPKADRARILRNVAWLEKTQIQDGANRGAWSYPGGDGDNSNSQFALLALYEAERAGVEINGRTLRLAKAYWESAQNPDGSWGYPTRHGGIGSMTCAGVASLVIASDMIHDTTAKVVDGRIQCCGGQADREMPIQQGLDWLGRRFTVASNPQRGATWMLYYLYGLERVGRLTAHRLIGGHDWYRLGSEHLVATRNTLDGSWQGAAPGENHEPIATSFALLFLSKGRRPVLMSKLEHGPPEQWNQHRTDVHNLTRHVETLWGRDLTWQVVRLRAASVEDLLQSPVLFLCGKDSPLPDSAAAQEELARKLRAYLDRGGFLFAEAYCGGAGFDRGFRELMGHVFQDAPEYRLRLLPPEHPIWRTEGPVDRKYVRPLWGIEFGCRTSVVYSAPDSTGKTPYSLSCLWEVARPGREREYGPEVRGQVDAALTIGANVLAYATNRQLRGKEEAFDEADRPVSAGPSPRGRLHVANLLHPGGCQAAPRALARLMDTAASELGVRVDAEPRDIRLTDESLFDYPMVFMQGRHAFSLTPAERERLATYVERGGLVLANSICASRLFTESFRREMEATFRDARLEPIPADDPLLTPTYGGFDLSTVTRRDPQRSRADEPLEDILRKVPPELEGIRVGDRWGVIFSRYDLSCALEKHDSLECQGYVREDAARIGLNVVLYALQQ